MTITDTNASPEDTKVDTTVAPEQVETKDSKVDTDKTVIVADDDTEGDKKRTSELEPAEAPPAKKPSPVKEAEEVKVDAEEAKVDGDVEKPLEPVPTDKPSDAVADESPEDSTATDVVPPAETTATAQETSEEPTASA